MVRWCILPVPLGGGERGEVSLFTANGRLEGEESTRANVGYLLDTLDGCHVLLPCLECNRRRFQKGWSRLVWLGKAGMDDLSMTGRPLEKDQ